MDLKKNKRVNEKSLNEIRGFDDERENNETILASFPMSIDRKLRDLKSSDLTRDWLD